MSPAACPEHIPPSRRQIRQLASPAFAPRRNPRPGLRQPVMQGLGQAFCRLIPTNFSEFQAQTGPPGQIFGPEYWINPKALLFVIFFTDGSTKIHKI